jgi:acetate---CoA ligase (ADP-forming)
VPAFASPESVTSALASMWRHGEYIRRAVSSDERSLESEVDLSDLPVGSLNEAQAKALFSRFGVTAVRERVVTSAHAAESAARDLGDKVVLKVLSNEITHKSDVGGVAVGVTADSIGARLNRMRDDVETATGVSANAFLVQEMVTGGTELILGLHRDPLGTVLLLGMGGVTAELFKDTTMRLLSTEAPLSRVDALKMIHDLKTWPLLDGFRGRPRADVDALVTAIVAFARMAVRLGGRMVEAEINPIFVLPAGQGVRAADGVAVLASEAHDEPSRCEQVADEVEAGLPRKP